MPNVADHVINSQSNDRMTGCMSANGFKDWAITTMFYSAVHLVEAVRFAKTRGHSYAHSDRRRFVKFHMPEISSAFKMLEESSRQARYMCWRFSKRDIKVAAQQLERIRTAAVSVTGASAS